jgi:hypothetical protein
MRKPLAHLVCQGLFVVLTGSLLAGCQKADDQLAGVPPPTTVRHDIPELVTRFPPLVEPASAAWVLWSDDGGGDGDAPADPQVEWLDAVVQLAPGSAEALIAFTRPTDTGRKPSVQEILRPDVPEGPFLTGDALDQAFSSVTASSYAYLDQGRNILVLQSTGVRG